MNTEIGERRNRELIQFVEIVRKCEHDEEEAPVEMAIDHCIRNHILEDFLRERRAEVLKAMTIDEFNPSRPREAANSIYAVSSDEAIRLQCEARERYERDWAGSYESGRREGIKEGIEQEKINTDREKKRADDEKKRADEAEKQLEMERRKHKDENKALRGEIERLKAAAN